MLKSTHKAAALPPPLPEGWTEHKAPTGHTYYYNASTSQSTYTRPSAPASAPQPVPNLASGYPGHFTQNFGTQGEPSGAHFPRHQHQNGRGRGRGDFRGGRSYQDRGRREPEDKPKSKHALPGCEPWLLVKTKLGRRFVYDPEKEESFWKFPEIVLKGVVEYDRLEREKKERKARGEESDTEVTVQNRPVNGHVTESKPTPDGHEDDSDSYEEVEVTDSEGEEGPSKRTRTSEGGPDPNAPVDFDEDDIAYQLAQMGQEYGLDPGEYEVGEGEGENYEEGAEGLPLTDEEMQALFRDLLDDYQIKPYTTWEKIIEEGQIINDDRYTVLPNMRARKESFAVWSTERISELRARRDKEEKKDPRIPYLAFLHEHATPKLYWPEFKRKFKKEDVMRDNKISDKERERLYRDHISRLKLPESTRKSDLSAMLKSVSLPLLNRSTALETLPPSIRTDLRYISLSAPVRDPLVEAYISTLPAAPEATDVSTEEQEELDRKRADREKREKALADREAMVQEEKRKQMGALKHSKGMLRDEELELERAMRVGKEGLKGHFEGSDMDVE